VEFFLAGRLNIDGTAFRDSSGRHVLLRGVNLGGDTKLPVEPDGHTYLPSDFADHRTVSFVGRPAPLDELDAHLARIAGWGFNCLRLLTTWEAVEHAGPGLYDEPYLDYYAEVCRRAGRHGLHVFVDFHQDVWSRMSGGDGAPGWTFEVAGLDFTKFHAADAALLMQHNYDHTIGGRQASYPTMAWGGNYAQPVNGIIWSLFFAGADFAPSAQVDGVNVQHFLQDRYFGAVRAVAERVADIDAVIGFDTLNEPGTGYIGKAMQAPIVRGQGLLWSPLEGLAAASGMTRSLPEIEFGKGVVGTRTINSDGVSIWLPGHADPFREAGAWDVGADGDPVALIPDYFQRRGDHVVDHEHDYMLPFFHRVADTMRAVRADWLVFAEIDPFDAGQGRGFPEGMPERTVNASHWYDISALVTKRFDAERMTHVLTGEVREGAKAIEDGYTREIGVLRQAGDRLNGGAPTLIGECGIQYDMNEAQAYDRWAGGERSSDIWRAQTAALDLMYNAFDRLLVSSAQWNYTVSNRNDPMIGDGWNQEDLSIWSLDQTTDDPSSGGRAVEGFCRPFVRIGQGTVIRQSFDRASGLFEAEIEIDAAITAPTEIFVPDVQYPAGAALTVDPALDVEHDGQVVRFRVTQAGTVKLRVTRR
jgi:hypothetical protein